MDNTLPPAESAPMDADEVQLVPLMKDAAKTVAARSKTFLGIWASTSLPGLILLAIAAILTGLGDREALRASLDAGRYGPVGGFMVVALISKLLEMLAFAASVVICAHARAGEETGLAAALERALERLPALIWTTIVVAVRVILGLIALIVPGIVMAIRYAFAPYATILEGPKGGAAARRSREIIIPHMGKFVGYTLAFAVVAISAHFLVLGIGGLLRVLVARLNVTALTVAWGLVVEGADFLVKSWSAAVATFFFLGLGAALPPKPAEPPPAAPAA